MNPGPANAVDPAPIEAWLAARSVARDLPPPIPDRGGFRIDGRSDGEISRWIFPGMADGLAELAREIASPGYLLKPCGEGRELAAIAPARWALRPPGYAMVAGGASQGTPIVPRGYRVECEGAGGKSHARIFAPDGSLAAEGYAGEAAGAFAYDRISTSPGHRRRGLGRAVMAALGAMRRSRAAPQVLVATEDGRKLYESLGWSIASPYSTIAIPPEARPGA